MIKQALKLLIGLGEAVEAPKRAAQGRAMETQGDVLKDAGMEIHSVAPAGPPASEPEAEVDDPDPEPQREGPLTWYHVELTLRPAGGADATWEPCGFILAGPDSQSGFAGMGADNHRDWGEIYEIQIWDGGAWRDADMEAYRGAQRLRLHLGVPAGVETVRFRYHFTVFGEVKLT